MFVTCVESPQTSVTKSLYSVSCRVRGNVINVKNAVFDKFLIILALLIFGKRYTQNDFLLSVCASVHQ